MKSTKLNRIESNKSNRRKHVSQPGVVEFERHGHLAGSEALMKITTELHYGQFGDLGGFGFLGASLLRLEIFAFLNLSPRLQTLEK